MIERLFVYGTLAPGEINHDWLESLEGTWEAATALGSVEIQTLGVHKGLPCFKPSTTLTVDGLIFTSSELSKIWNKLDDFEGVDYTRQLVNVTTSEGHEVEAYVYVDKYSL